MGGGDRFNLPPPPSKLGVKNTPSKLRLREKKYMQHICKKTKIIFETYFFPQIGYFREDMNKN